MKVIGFQKFLSGRAGLIPLILCFAGGLPPQVGVAQEAPSRDEVLAPVSPPLVFEPTWIDMPEVTEVTFPTLRAEALAALGPGRASSDLWLDYGRVLFNGGYFPEAMSALEQAARLGFSQSGPARGQAALLALGLEAAGRGSCRCGGFDPRVEAGASYFAVLIALSQDADPASARIAALSMPLARQSAAVIRFVGPMLFDAAIRAQDRDLAGRLLQALSADGAVGPAALLRMRGDEASLRGDEAEAFGYYVDTLDHHDVEAIQARLRIADMALEKRDSAALQAVRDFLIEGLQQWHGGAAELSMLTRLAATSEALLDAPAALEAMARIRSNYPQAPQAVLAGDRAGAILRHHATTLAEGRTGLADYARLMRRLRGGLADLAEWVPARVALAEAFEREGMQVAAAAEYLAIRADISSYGSPVTRATEAALLRDHLRLLAGTGAKSEALTELRLRSDLIGESFALRETALTLMDGPALDAMLAALPQAVFAPRERLAMARVRFDAGDRAAALREWGGYLASGQPLSGADAADYLFAKFVEEHPDSLPLTSIAPADAAVLGGLATALARPPAASGPLDLGSARQILEDAAAAVKMAEIAKK